MKALISDIHGNHEALTAVLADIDSIGVKDVYCLGDVVGYGPNPIECVKLVRQRCCVVLMGNHDYAAVDPGPRTLRYTLHARNSAVWTHDTLKAYANSTGDDMLSYLEGLPRRLDEPDAIFVHASPRDPLEEYVFSHVLYQSPSMVKDLFDMVSGWCFMGHTHQGGLFKRTGEYDFVFSPADLLLAGRARGSGEAVMCNVGSVGQPRDGNPNACYCLYDEAQQTVTFRRVAYDFLATGHKILQIPALNPQLAERLKTGT